MERRLIALDDTLYRLMLDDYSAASFTSFGKAYYGTFEQIASFINSLETDEDLEGRYKDLISAFHKFCSGDQSVTHNVAYQRVPLLEPVKLIGSATQRLDNYRWDHKNTWGWPYAMRCDTVETQHYWIAAEGYYARCVVALFENLAYHGVGSEWNQVGGMFWGFPHIIESSGNLVTNTLLVEEKRFTKRKDMFADKEAFHENRDVDFHEFCNDIFGDG